MRIRHIIRFLLLVSAVTTAQTMYSGSPFILSNINVSNWKLTISDNETVAGIVVVE